MNTEKNSEIMNTIIEQKTLLKHDAIANLACQIWEKNGRQAGQDQEHWLQAERQLRAISKQGHAGTNQVFPQHKATAATGKKVRGII